MPLDRRIAATIARENGLNLSDAQALSVLADTEDEASELAAQFAPTPEPEDTAGDGLKIADRILNRGGMR